MTDRVRSGTLVGRQIGSYQVLALLGAGGMGEVYRARDTRLGRDVALKVLRRDRADDPAQQATLRREAQAASTLNHPNILAVYDVGVDDGISFIITELVDGTSLREKVERGTLPLKELLDLATQVAEGLTVAHEADIVHRDLKPENVMVTRHGVAKILDFGLALAPRPTAPASGGTLHVTRTETGLIQGTVPYMSPEQAQGAAGDFRSDQFALGLMLYEMMTGTQAFRRETPVQTLSAIITDEAPPITGPNSRAPAQLKWIIERCLAKDPRQRYAATRDLAQDLRTLRERLAEIAANGAVIPNGARRRSTVGILLVGTTLAILVLGIDLSLRLRSDDAAPARIFAVPPPSAATFPSSSAFMAVSPDGRWLAFVASSPEGKNALWLRPFDSPIALQLSGTEGAGQPFWSPDSRFLAFGAGRLTKKVDVRSKVVETLGQNVGSGTWNADNIIVGPRKDSGLYRISATGGGDGPATPVTTLDPSRAETGHLWPYFLPDGRHFLYVSVSREPQYDGTVWVGSLDSTERMQLPLPGDSNVAYVAPGYLLFMKTDTLFAVRFDAQSLRLTGEKVMIAERVERTAGSHRGAFSISQAGGVLAYRQIGETQLAFWNRTTGRMIESIGSNALYGNPALSADEHTVAVNRRDSATGTQDVWLIDTARGAPSRFTFEPSNEPSDELAPLWFADGIMFRSNKKPPPSEPAGPGFYAKARGNTGPGHLVKAGVGAFGFPLGYSADGSLLYQAYDAKTGMDLWALPVAGDRKPVGVVHTTANEAQGQLSPDRRWIAYLSDETGSFEVYVRPFPSGDGKWRISTSGGIEPKWGRDGTELFYLAPDQWLMSVVMKAFPRKEPEIPGRLFKTRMMPATDLGYTRNQYEVTKDGRFLINQAESPTPITVVLNWTARLTR